MLLQWPPPLCLNPVFGCLSGKDGEPEGNVRCLHLPGVHTAEPRSEETSGQYEMSVPKFTRAITAFLRAFLRRVDGSTQPLCSGVSPNDKVINRVSWAKTLFLLKLWLCLYCQLKGEGLIPGPETNTDSFIPPLLRATSLQQIRLH